MPLIRLDTRATAYGPTGQFIRKRGGVAFPLLFSTCDERGVAVLSFRGLQCHFPGRTDAPPVLSGVDLSLEPGARLALLGPNGSGKSTMLRSLCGLSEDAGWEECLLDGRGVRPGEDGRALLRRAVGLVGQDPDDQLVCERVYDDVAFGPCNLGLPEEEVRRRVEESLRSCGLEGLADKSCSELSGGQRQRVCIAGILSMRPSYLLLDEPCSMLDPDARSQVMAAADAAARRGVGVILATHELRDVLGYDRVLALGKGTVAWSGAPAQLLSRPDVLKAARCHVSAWPRALAGLAASGGLPPGVDLSSPAACGAGLRMRGAPAVRPERPASAGVTGRIAPQASRVTPRPAEETSRTTAGGPAGLALDQVSHSYGLTAPGARLLRSSRTGAAGGGGPTSQEYRDLARGKGRELALDGVSLLVPPGGLAVVTGPNGSGKTTLLRVACGLIVPGSGSARLDGAPVRPGAVACAMQRPHDQMFCDTVEQDVAFSPRRRGVEPDRARALAHDCMGRVGLDPALFAGRSPFSLSGGQARRAALAGVLACESRAVVLDEPAAGLDAGGLEDLLSLIEQMQSAGTAVTVVTHDPGALLDRADALLVLRSGRARPGVLPPDPDEAFFRAWAGVPDGD